MEKIFVFDVDGTLTEPRQPINRDFRTFFCEFSERNTVYLASGSDLPKVREQLDNEILQLCSGVFTCSGAEFWQADQMVYRKKHDFPDELIELCQNFIDGSSYGERCGRHVEYRPGMINISVVGRNATVEQRQAYSKWDSHINERRCFAEQINSSHYPYEASVGGEISIDIAPVGWNKSVVLTELLQRHREGSVVFFGDRMNPGGNDRPLADAIAARGDPHRAYSVRSYQDTWDALRNAGMDSKRHVA